MTCSAAPGRAVKRVLVNKYETSGDAMLRDLETPHADRLFIKVRLADVIDVDKPVVIGRRKAPSIVRKN
jgi:hypothetical protein